MLKIKKIVASEGSIESLSQQLDTHEKQAIACVNWPQISDYAPRADFAIAHDGKRIFLKFYVSEACTAALNAVNDQPVCVDSCVEFFVSFDDRGYYNFEFNAIGTLLVRFRKERPAPTYAAPEIFTLVERLPSLGREPFAERAQPAPWSLTVIIPVEALYGHCFEDLSGVKATANFYKCGDKLSKPHYLSWNPIPTETPSFHSPQYFGAIEFE